MHLLLSENVMVSAEVRCKFKRKTCLKKLKVTSTHHFVVDFVKVYFAYFIYYIFTLKRDESET